jgi:MFS family permease
VVAFACVISFMGIGLVDPLLPALRVKLHASPSQVELLFTSYLVVTAGRAGGPPGGGRWASGLRAARRRCRSQPWDLAGNARGKEHRGQRAE